MRSAGCPALLSAPRLVCEFPWQPEANLDVFVDTDFAGCVATRRSTSGGAAMRSSARCKKAVTLSCAEAELSGIFKGTTDTLGNQSVGRDFGLSMTLSFHTDSAAAVGICKRAGIGRVDTSLSGNCG